MPPPTHTRHRRVLPGAASWPLHDIDASRAIETEALDLHAPHALMQSAGLAVARLALALTPHAHRVWVACGPGNNGGDGWIAARHLHLAGLAVTATLAGDARHLPGGAAQALADALHAGVTVSAEAPDGKVDLAIDALLGLGATRAPQGAMAETIGRLNQLAAPVLAVDLPSGLHANTGQRHGAQAVRATHTLSLLTLKQGLFTALGRDHAGEVWFDSLDESANPQSPTARLAGASDLADVLPHRTHASHKGSWGDVAVVGGAPGMTGAALLAARAAVAAGAGRVFVCLLDTAACAVDATRPELMFRPGWWHNEPAVLAASTVVCGCGGGSAVRAVLPALLARCARLVLDADALNALAHDTMLQRQLIARAGRGQATVFTPHPLEAARLLQSDVATVQADRLSAARELSRQYVCAVLLKGSGSIVAAPDCLPVINPTGNALLASGGTGDVLAGWIGGLWAQLHATAAPHAGAQQATLAAAWLHGHAADLQLATSPSAPALRAGDLIELMRNAAFALGGRGAR